MGIALLSSSLEALPEEDIWEEVLLRGWDGEGGDVKLTKRGRGGEDGGWEGGRKEALENGKGPEERPSFAQALAALLPPPNPSPPFFLNYQKWPEDTLIPSTYTCFITSLCFKAQNL